MSLWPLPVRSPLCCPAPSAVSLVQGTAWLQPGAIDVSPALGFVVELDEATPAAVFAVLESRRPDELWRRGRRLELGGRGGLNRPSDAAPDRRAEKQDGNDAHDHDPGDNNGVLSQRLSRFRRVPPPSHSRTLVPQAATAKQDQRDDRRKSLDQTVAYPADMLQEQRERTSKFVAEHGDLPIRANRRPHVAAWLKGNRITGSVPALRAFFNDAASAPAGRLVDRNPSSKLGLRSRRGRRDTQPPSQVEIARFVALADELTPPSFAAFLHVAVYE